MCRRNLTVELSINSYYEVELGGADFADEDWVVYEKYNKLSRSRAVTSRLVPRTVLEHSWGKVFNQRATSYDQGTVQIQRARPSFNVQRSPFPNILNNIPKKSPGSTAPFTVSGRSIHLHICSTIPTVLSTTPTNQTSIRFSLHTDTVYTTSA